MTTATIEKPKNTVIGTIQVSGRTVLVNKRPTGNAYFVRVNDRAIAGSISHAVPEGKEESVCVFVPSGRNALTLSGGPFEITPRA